MGVACSRGIPTLTAAITQYSAGLKNKPKAISVVVSVQTISTKYTGNRA
jgi:hypothetical protein